MSPSLADPSSAADRLPPSTVSSAAASRTPDRGRDCPRVFAAVRSPGSCSSGARCSSLTLPHSELLAPWIRSGDFLVNFEFYLDQLTAGDAAGRHRRRLLIHIYAVGYMAHEGGYYRFFAYLNLFMFFMLMLVLARQLPAAVRRLGRRGPVHLPADRLLLQQEVRRRRRQEGIHRQPHRRLRFRLAMFLI